MWTLRFSIEINFRVSLATAIPERLLLAFCFVNLFRQGKKAAKGSDDAHNQKDDGQQRFGVEYPVQQISNGQPDDHRKAHFETDCAHPGKLPVKFPLVLLGPRILRILFDVLPPGPAPQRRGMS